MHILANTDLGLPLCEGPHPSLHPSCDLGVGRTKPVMCAVITQGALRQHQHTLHFNCTCTHSLILSQRVTITAHFLDRANAPKKKQLIKIINYNTD